jgi:hypothetical protein
MTDEGLTPRYLFRNDAGETIPPYAVMRVTGLINVDDSYVLTVEKPDEKKGRLYVVNWKNAVKPGGFGRCAWDGPLVAGVVQSDGAVTSGEKRGTKKGDWFLRSKKEGGRSEFVIVGQTEKQGKKTAIVLPFWCV